MRWYQSTGRTRMQSGKLKYKKLEVMQPRITKYKSELLTREQISLGQILQMKFHCKMIRAKGEKTSLKERRFY